MIIVAHVMLYLVLLCIALSPHSVEADFSPWRDQEHERDMRKRKEASWREAEAEAEAVEEQPPAKKQKTWADGNLRAFVTKHAPPAAKIAAFSYVLRADHLQDGERLRRLPLLGLA